MKTLIVFVQVCLKQSHLSRLLRVPWTAKRSNQSILKEINSEYSLEGLMLKLQYFGHLKWRVDSLEKTLMLGKTEGGRRRGQQRWDVGYHHQLNGHEFEQTPGDTERQRSLACCSPCSGKESDSAPEQQQLSVKCVCFGFNLAKMMLWGFQLPAVVHVSTQCQTDDTGITFD